MTRRIRRRLAAIVWIAIAGMPRASAAAPPAAQPAHAQSFDLRYDVRDRSEALWDAGHAAESVAYLDSVARTGRERGDPALALAARLWRAQRLAFRPVLRSSCLALLDSLDREATALACDEARCWILVTRGNAENVIASRTKAIADYTSAAALARTRRFRFVEGVAIHGLAIQYFSLGRFDAALRALDRAEPLLPKDSTPYGRSEQIRFAIALSRGDADGARRAYRRGMDKCRNPRLRRLAAFYENQMGTLQEAEHDPAAALPYFERAVAMGQGTLDSATVLPFEINAARARGIVVSPAQGLKDLLELLPRCERLQRPVELGMIHAFLSDTYLDIAEPATSLMHARLARPMAKSDVETYVYVTNTMIRCYAATGQLDSALALADTLLASGPLELKAEELATARSARTAVLLQMGRRREALAFARTAELQSRPAGTSMGRYWLENCAMLARALRENGRPDSAVRVLGPACRDWERRRDRIASEEWRENRGSAAAGLFAELGLSLLAPDRRAPEALRTRQAFDALQEFQARTLEERMRGSGLSARAMAHRVTADSLQRSLLGPDDLLLDYVAMPETTIAFAVTRREIRVRFLPGLESLTPRIRRLSPAMEQAHAGPGAVDVLRWMTARVVAPFQDLIAAHPHIVITGGGTITLLPWSALADEAGTPLLQSHTLVFAPSATIWAMERTSRTPAPARSMLVVGRTTDREGRVYRGVEEECRAVAAQPGATLRLNPGNLGLTSLLADLGQFRTIHIAAHMYADNANPWRSGVLLGAGSGDAAYLRASDIATRRIGARLVVLSGCASAAARSLPGEGPQGLASAFLCAGASTVVATLWQVRDDVAADFATRLHAALGRRVPASQAVREAQLGMRAAGRGAGDWSAFVVWGSGGDRAAMN